VLEWWVEGALGGRQLEWVAEKQAVLSSLRYLLFIFLFFTNCRNHKSYIFTVSERRKFKFRIYDSYGLYKL